MWKNWKQQLRDNPEEEVEKNLGFEAVSLRSYH